jgi:hypothetical protein
MRTRQVFAMSAVLVSFACGAAPGTGGATPPNAPVEALAAWKSFPAHQTPRPIVLLGIPGPSAYAGGDAKIAAYCNRYRLAFQPSTVAPQQGVATWADHSSVAYQTVSEAAAYAAMAGMPTGMNAADCAAAAVLDVTAGRFGVASFASDRGTAEISAWLFTVTGVSGDVVYPAIVPSAFWGGRVTNEGLGGGGVPVSADGRTLKYGFTGGECDAGYMSAVAESDNAVAVRVVAIPKSGQGTCNLIGHPESVTISLASPLGGRVLLNDQGIVEAACPPGLGTC